MTTCRNVEFFDHDEWQFNSHRITWRVGAKEQNTANQNTGLTLKPAVTAVKSS